MDKDIRQGLKTEVRVKAGQPFYGLFRGSAPYSHCAKAFSFVPQEGRDHEVVYWWDYWSLFCTVSLTVIDDRREPASNIAMPVAQCAQEYE